MANEYPPETVGIALSNELANLWLEHCRRTDSLESGLRASALFIEIGAQPPGLNDHYVIALTCDVLLLRFNEVTLAAEGYPSLRADAIAHARSAAAIAESRLAVDPNGALTLAQTEVLLSRLLASGRAGVDEKLEAVAVAEQALNRNVLSVAGASDVRVSRAAIVVDLPDADAALLGQAIDALEQNVAELRASGPAERLWKNLFNLGQLYHRNGRALDAIRLLQESAEVSRRLLVKCGTPEMLADEARKYLFVFEALASQLAAAGRGRDALVAYETLRGVVPRVAANESQRTQMAVRSTMDLLERMALSDDPTYRPEDPLEFLSPDVDSELQALCTQLLDVQAVLIYYGWFGDRATALLIDIGAADALVCIEALQWPFLDFPSRTVEEDALQDLRTGYGKATSRVPPLFNAMVYADPGPLRNLRLHDASLDAYRYLLGPLEERLKALGAKRVERRYGSV